MLYLLYLVSALGIFVLSIARKNYFFEQSENFSPSKTGYTCLFFILLLIGYFLIIRNKRVISKKTTIFIFTIAIIFFITPPVFSKDIGAYLIAARNFFEFHQNPFTTPLAFLGNPWVFELKNVWWMKYPSSYGPLFFVITLPAVVFGLKSLAASIYIYKIFVFGTYVSSVYLFKKITSKKTSNFWPAFALNPAILVNVLIDGHNEIFSIFFLLLSLYSLKVQKWKPGLLAFLASTLIKFNTVLFLPILWIKMGKFSLKRIATSILIVIAPLAVFAMTYRSNYSNLFAILNNKCIYSCTFFVNASSILFRNYSVLFRDVFLLVVYCLVFYLYIFLKKDIMKFVFWSYAALLFLNIAWITPWYPIVIIPIGLLIDNDRPFYQTLTFLLTFYSLFHFFGI